LFINVYFPCNSVVDWENEYLECLASILSDVSICDVQYKYIVFGGDIYVDFGAKKHVIDDVSCFMIDLNLLNSDCKLSSGVNFSYRAYSSVASSLIKHFSYQNHCVAILVIWIY